VIQWYIKPFLTYFLWAFVLLGAAMAQNPYYNSFNLEYKFPHKEVYEIFQDKNANIWIGANPGLFMFDGKQIRHFEIAQLAGKSVSAIFADSAGNIFARNFRGQILRYAKGKYEVLFDWKDSIDQFPNMNLIQHKNWLLLTDNTRIYAYDLSLNSWKLLIDSFDFRFFSAIFVATNNDIWARWSFGYQ
jgi:ligand-binding sensor domain-containing protein